MNNHALRVYESMLGLLSGTIVVVIFPDNLFKYATSVRKHLPELFPPQQATLNTDPSSGDRDAPLITLCAVGQRFLVAMLVLKSIDYRNLKNVAGGLNAWVDVGLPT